MGHTVVLITHETYTAKYAERIVRLTDGKIECDGKSRKQKNKGPMFR
jgi:ABC-type transport system involved in cytochrome bd biosynthesis fused ATPase/permease subunit